jgi:hypothetical protein
MSHSLSLSPLYTTLTLRSECRLPSQEANCPSQVSGSLIAINANFLPAILIQPKHALLLIVVFARKQRAKSASSSLLVTCVPRIHFSAAFPPFTQSSIHPGLLLLVTRRLLGTHSLSHYLASRSTDTPTTQPPNQPQTAKACFTYLHSCRVFILCVVRIAYAVQRSP